MKKLYTVLMIALLFIQGSIQAQKNTAAVAATSAVAAAVVVKVQIEQLKEILEQTATEWVLMNDSLHYFNLKLINFEATKISDLSNVSAINFIVKPNSGQREPFILLLMCSKGWVNDFGLDFTRIKPLTIDKNYWKVLVKEYLQIAGHFKQVDIDNIPNYSSEIKENYLNFFGIGEVNNLNIVPTYSTTMYLKRQNYKVGLKDLIDVDGDDFDFEITGENGRKIKVSYPFRPLDGDTYVVKDLNSDMKIVYNEKDMSLFIKSTRDLVKIKRSVVTKITKELFSR